MNTYTLVWRHDFISAVRITVDIDSDDVPLAVMLDATTIMSEADDFIFGSELDMRDYTLVEIKFGGLPIKQFA